MKNRSSGIAILAFSSVLIGIYCQFAAVALILTGSVFSASGSVYAGFALIIGSLFFGLTFAAYFLAYGFWTRKDWSWAGGIALVITLVVASMALSVLSTNFTSTVLPLAAAVAGVWYLNRAEIKAELTGTEVANQRTVNVADTFEAAEPAH